jgi:hypothetical protein
MTGFLFGCRDYGLLFVLDLTSTFDICYWILDIPYKGLPASGRAVAGVSFFPFSIDRHWQKGIMIVAFANGQKVRRRRV